MKILKASLALRLITVSAAILSVTQNVMADWVAGRDLALNERPNGPQELGNPNTTVPLWSYGYRSTIGGTALTYFPNHQNDVGGYTNIDGWDTSGIPSAYVNAGTSPVVFDFGHGPLTPLQPKEMDLHPSTDYVVVRWTAPSSGVFTINAYWKDIDPYGGNGGDGHIVIGGTSIYDTSWGSGNFAVAPTIFRVLFTGDIVDFVLGPTNGDFGFDSTSFDARTAVFTPEPSAIASLSVGALFLFVAARFRKG